MFLWPNHYPVHPHTLSEMCVCVCRGLSLSLPLPLSPSLSLSLCSGIQIPPHTVLDNEVFNRNRISKDHLNLYEQFLIAARCQRRAPGSVSEGPLSDRAQSQSNFPSPATSSSLWAPAFKHGWNKRVLLCSGKYSINLSPGNITSRKSLLFPQNNVKLVDLTCLNVQFKYRAATNCCVWDCSKTTIQDKKGGERINSQQLSSVH